MISFNWKVLEVKRGLIIIFLNNGKKAESEDFSNENAQSLLVDED